MRGYFVWSYAVPQYSGAMRHTIHRLRNTEGFGGGGPAETVCDVFIDPAAGPVLAVDRRAVHHQAGPVVHAGVGLRRRQRPVEHRHHSTGQNLRTASDIRHSAGQNSPGNSAGQNSE